MAFYTHPGPDVTATASVERMRITGAGNVGIGTTNPGNYRLNVSKGAAGDVAQFTDGVAHTFLVRTDASTLFVGQANNFPLVLVTNNTEKVRITAAGDVGIGTTSPADRLHVIGNLSLGSSSNAQIIYRTASNWRYHLGAVNDDFFIYDAQNVNYFAAYYNGGGTGKYASILGALNVINSGNVGIGTTSPTQKLHVNGNATAADFILTSDRRLKRDLVEITGALATVLSWAGYTYRPVNGERRRAGLMAQDVEPTAPELVYTGEDGYKSLSYEQAVPYLVEAIRDLYRMIEALA